MTYAGHLVTLRPQEPGDAAAHHRWLNDPEVRHWLGPRYPMSLPQVAERVATEASFADTRFGVVANDTGALVGCTALRGTTPENRDAELDLVIGERAAWGRGYGTEATRLTCRWGFDRLGLHRVHVWVLAGHDAAIRVYERAGFVREALARDRTFTHGRWHDSVLMGLLPEELR